MMPPTGPFLARRALGGLVVLLFVLGSAFAIVRLLPGDPVEMRLESAMVASDPETALTLRRSLGLDQPLWSQFAQWVGGLVRLDTGRSLMSDRPVLAEITARLPWSVAIGLGGLALGASLGTLLGYAAAIQRGGPASVTARLLVILSQALPAFGVAYLVFWLVAIELRWIRPVLGSPIERIAAPAFVVALFSIGSFARITSATLATVETAQWFVTALAKGLSRTRALFSHGGRWVAITNLSVLVPELGWAIGGTAVSEIVFGIPGLSAFVVEAASARDYAVLQAYLAAVLAWFLCAHCGVVMLHKRLDPRPGEFDR